MPMSHRTDKHGNPLAIVMLAIAACLSPNTASTAQQVPHLNITQRGGMPGVPVLTGITAGTNGPTITWEGPAGYYQIFEKQNVTAPAWQAVGGPTNLNRIATVPGGSTAAFFQIEGPSSHYSGARNCASCHSGIAATETNLPHAFALETLHQIHQDNNPNCAVCHTVGFGLPTGFVSVTDSRSTNFLAGVQCENCHGPAGNHAANPLDFSVLPRVEPAAQVCGGCHSDAQHPTFEEWQGSPHGAVVPAVLQSMTSSTNSINSCGRCHSGTARLALLHGENPSVTVANDFNVPITCVTCHDPHASHTFTNVLSGVVTNQFDGIVITNNELGAVYANQLRNPLSSTNYYSLSTADVFTNKYNPNINLCAQCHNARGAAWTDTSRSPHHSPQYNMLLGSVGILGTNAAPSQPSTHALMEKQCVFCHMQTSAHQNGPPEVAAVTGHGFEVNSFNACTKCHGPDTTQIAGSVGDFQSLIKANAYSFGIQDVKALLDQWGKTAAPAALRTKYGALAWEYTNPGDLAPAGSAGPTTAEQALIPDDIKKARFDLYLVLYDGSYGVHNGPYTIALLETARDLVVGQLNQ